MKSSQALPGPQSGNGNLQSPLTGGLQRPDVSPAITPPEAANPAPVAKPGYGGVDVSPVIAPSGSGGNPWRDVYTSMGSNAGKPVPDPMRFMVEHAAQPNNNQGQIIANALRTYTPGYRPPLDPNQAQPPTRSLGGWQALMQRMQPR